MMPNQDYFISIMKTLGISRSDTVVTYDYGNGLHAHRTAFMFQAMGHPSVRVLDGSFAKWIKEGREVESSEVEDSEFDYAYSGTYITDYEGIRSLSKRGAQIVDARSSEDFAKGNIPSAVNIPAANFLSEDGTMKSSEELKAIFADANVDLSLPTTYSCGRGLMATAARAAALKAGA